MFVTLDVSRLSGWLNADARCRVERGTVGGGATCGQAGRREGWGGQWRKQQGGPIVEAEGRARTLYRLPANMYAMSLTLDVLKLSGWLNAYASCQVKRESIGGGATSGQAGVKVGWGGRWRKQQGGPDCGG